MIDNKPDIIETISEFVDLKRVGQNYKGLCPFHSEKTPSFTASSARQRWKCFGCGEGGDLPDFIMKYHNLSFTDALSYLGIKKNGRPVKHDPVKQRAWELKREFREWTHKRALHLAELLRWLDDAKSQCRNMIEVEKLSAAYHKSTSWELEYQILMDKDEQNKFDLFRSEYGQHRSAA